MTALTHRTAAEPTSPGPSDGRLAYKWVALSNTTLGILMATVNSSIVLISLPAVFRGIGLDPLAAGNVSYLLWLLMGYMLVTAVLVVTLGRLGDIYGRVRIYNAGFAVFALSSAALALVPFSGGGGALWLIGFRVVQGIGGSMLMANSTAILTDAFPAHERGMALGINQVAGIAGSFIGLVVGGVLSEWDWRAIFWVSVPLGVLGTVWAYRSLRETSTRGSGRIDWWGNLTFGVGLTALLAGITYGIQPYGGHTEGWTNPWVLLGIVGGLALLVVFVAVERRVDDPMFHLELFRTKPFWTGATGVLTGAIARGGLQFMLIIWLQGIWLPLHGYDYESTPLWAGIYLLPLTLGFLVAGPVSGYLSDRHGALPFTVGGMSLMALSFLGLLALPTDFSYWAFATLILLNGVGAGLYTAPNMSAIMGSVPARQRGASAGMVSTFQNSGMVLSMGVFFSLLIAGLAGSLPHALRTGLVGQGVSSSAADSVAGLPPVGTVFASFLGYNPIGALLTPTGELDRLPAANRDTLTGTSFFPHLISGPFHDGLVVVFVLAAVMAAVAAVLAWVRGDTRAHVHEENRPA
ncbi:putative MFS family arabinose efflux permease [Motilibacter peucedani]|uniref:Putative MFS family arabinose efflux permease n=1 Tax=Motilibacter peucedani TaxID=598650 RepID=A0A420XL88_9ACTN|nr:MFS transporter [Motilibacter peucedani]RKS69296.1 putative MFS family arabinose efflux permease [Motilibacter peucedani]